jgi:hypothetical protein
MGISRRGLLAGLVGGTVVATIPGSSLVERLADVAPVAAPVQVAQDWSFLDVKASKPEWRRDRFVPLGPRTLVGGPEYGRLQNIARRKVSEGVVSGKINGSVSLYKESFGVPAEGREGKALLSYANNALNFLRDQVKNLAVTPPQFRAFMWGDDYTNSTTSRAFLGKSSFTIYTADIPEEGKDSPTRVFLDGSHNTGSFGRIYAPAGVLHDEWCLFVAMGEAGLVGPFSEVIPLTTISVTGRYIDQTGNHNLGMMADETVAEGMSHLLARQYVTERGLPEGAAKIRGLIPKMQRVFPKKYAHIDEAVAWMEQNGGPQNGLDAYMSEGPVKFMKRLGVDI